MSPLVALACVPLAVVPDIVLLSMADVPGLQIVSVERYEGKALYGYIDGGADLYNEYGFLRLAVQRCTYRAAPLTLEIHEMTDAVAAVGIFSVSSADCGTHEALGSFSCVSPEVVQWASSRYFVRVINTDGSVGGGDACLTLAVALQAKLGGDSLQIPASLAMMRAPPGTVKVMRGRLGLENGFDHWSALFEGFSGFELFVLPILTGGGRAAVAEARFAGAADAERFSARFTRTSDTGRRLWRREDGRVILLEAAAGADSLRAILESCPGCPP